MRVFRILQRCASLACPFRGLNGQWSCANIRLDLSLGMQRGRGKGERANIRAWCVAYIALTTLFFRTFPFTASVLVITLTLQTFALVETFLESDQLHTYLQQSWKSCAFHLLAPLPCMSLLESLVNQWLATEKRLVCSTHSKPPWWVLYIFAKYTHVKRLTVHRVIPQCKEHTLN